MKTKNELLELAKTHNWSPRKLTSAEISRMGADEFEYHCAFNRLAVEKAQNETTPTAASSPHTLAVDAQKALVHRVLSRYPAYVFSDHNAKAMNAALGAIKNPRLDEAEVVETLQACMNAGKLELKLPSGRVVSGQELMRITASEFQSLISPTVEKDEAHMSAAEYRAAHAEDFETEVPDVLRADRQKVMLTVLALPEFAGMALDHDDTTFLAREMKRQGLLYNVQNIAALIRSNRDRFYFEPEAAEIHGQVVSTRFAG